MLSNENLNREGEKMMTWSTMKAIFDELMIERHHSKSNKTWSEVSMHVVASIPLISI
jgi:hypothetical protein